MNSNPASLICASLRFIPSHEDMEGRFHGLLVSSFGEDGDGELLAVGPGLSRRRAISACATYLRTVCGYQEMEQWFADLRAARWTVAITPTAFTREPGGCWQAHPHSSGAASAAWIVRPGAEPAR
ncbi:hypothetical protein [Streptomyces antarcticus]|uniref:hypothetical protein n=1 Tax=Streptomyces antarcticus TaxID=2996458 RepID=UPI0022720FBB|nr:hypothetical protein [Streptomyces sp. H34-AA3]MCY0946290.1 hypothetical protein [Streptomyces sp. H34-AA3]